MTTRWLLVSTDQVEVACGCHFAEWKRLQSHVKNAGENPAKFGDDGKGIGYGLAGGVWRSRQDKVEGSMKRMHTLMR
jgi:hypothetical protein